MRAHTLYFQGDETVTVREEPVPSVTPETVIVETSVSAVSAGSEGLVYRGAVPDRIEATGEVGSLDGAVEYPLSYGYATVGRVIEVGEAVDDDWLERRVFAYAGHRSHVRASPGELVPVPEEVSTATAALFANCETAVTLHMDGRPVIGDRVTVFGQGVVGLLTTGLLARSPVGTLEAVEPVAGRRELARAFGADRALEPGDGDTGRADLTYELSGNPAALDRAITATAFDGRVVVGSWYGREPATLSLGDHFHRQRIDVESSQVSTLPPHLSGRWDRDRRHAVTWEWVKRLPVAELITHEVPLEEAGRAYELLTERPASAVGVLFTYE